MTRIHPSAIALLAIAMLFTAGPTAVADEVAKSEKTVVQGAERSAPVTPFSSKPSSAGLLGVRSSGATRRMMSARPP